MFLLGQSRFIASRLPETQKVHANFLISGWKKQDGHRHAVMIVPHDRLEKVKEKFISITSLHVYSVGLINSDSQIGLQNVDYDQTERYFSDSLKTGNPYPFSDNRLSAICISGGAISNSKPVDTNLKQCSPKPVLSPSERPRSESRDGELDTNDDKSKRKSDVQELSVSRKRGQSELTELEGGRQTVSLIMPKSETALDGNEHARKAKVKPSVEKTLDVDKSCDQKPSQNDYDGELKSEKPGQKKRKVMQTYINDAGEEVTGQCRNTLEI
jgi:hypothetical protein